MTPDKSVTDWNALVAKTLKGDNATVDALIGAGDKLVSHCVHASNLIALVREYQRECKGTDDTRFTSACVALLDAKLPDSPDAERAK